MKNSPKPEDVRRRQKRLEAQTQAQPVAKRARIEIGETATLPLMEESSKVDSDVDRLELFIADRLGPEIATQLVMQAMVRKT
jgi:hypothetical protein